MILVFYNEDMNVCMLEYSASNGVLTQIRRDIYLNRNKDAKLFKDKLGETDYSINDVLLDAQERFRGHRVIIFDNSKDGTLYDRQELVDLLFVYRKNITILKADITEEDANSFADWLQKHYPY